MVYLRVQFKDCLISKFYQPSCFAKLLEKFKKYLFAHDTTNAVCTENMLIGQQFTEDLSAAKSWLLEIV